jgi:hypothetical protein
MYSDIRLYEIHVPNACPIAVTIKLLDVDGFLPLSNCIYATLVVKGIHTSGR